MSNIKTNSSFRSVLLVVEKKLSYHTPSIVQLSTYMKQLPVYILDHTLSDSASRVRGIGRYMQLLREVLHTHAEFVGSIKEIPYESIYLDAHFNFLQYEWPRRIAKYQIAFLYDLIPQKFPEQYPIGLKGKMLSQLSFYRLKQYDMILTLTEATKNDIVTLLGIAEDTVQVMYSTIPSNAVQKEQLDKQKIPEKPYFVYVGDVTWNKNLVALAKAIKIAQIPCAFVGNYFLPSNMKHTIETNEKPQNPWLNEVYSFYEEAYNNPLFLFQGFVNQIHLDNLYKNAAANILISRDEGFGMSFLEAAHQNTWSLLSDIPVFHEIAQSAATFIDPDDPVALADAMKAIVAGDENKNKKALLHEVVERFSQKEFKKRFVEVFASVQKH